MTAPLPSISVPRSGLASPGLRRAKPTTGRSTPMMQKYQVASLGLRGEIRTTHHTAPATPLFHDAFSALCHGTLLATDQGPIAVEDLLPGDRVLTEEFGAVPILWIGGTTLAPGTPLPGRSRTPLTRVMADAFGIGRPMPDLLAGPSARLCHRPGHAVEASRSGQVLSLITDFIDSGQVISVAPPSPVRLFHIGLERHTTVLANGLPVESYHPGPRALDGFGRNMQMLFLSLFPHIDSPEDFGPLAHPRFDRDSLSTTAA